MKLNNKNKVKIIFVDLLDRNNSNCELFASNNDTKLIKNQTMKGINKQDEIFIVSHFFVALIILY